MLLSYYGFGQVLTFVNKEKELLSEVRCIGFTENNESIASWVSNSNGEIRIDKEGVDRVLTFHPNYSDKMVFLKDLGTNTKIILSPAVELSEIVLRPKDVEEFDTHTSYYLSQEEMQRYPDVLQALNLIPMMTVLTNGSTFYQGESNIKILIDGVDASIPEVQSLSKEDIAKINIYRNPPIRFLAQGISNVIDIRLKSKLHGGNGSINISQAFQSLIGNNSAALFYNYKQSRFSLMYGNENKHYRDITRNETLDYEFDGIRYRKEKVGNKFKKNLDNNDIRLSYQVNKPENYLYNVKAGIGINRDGDKDTQMVMTDGENFLATNNLTSGYTRYYIGNYFEKNFGEDGGTLIANANYQYYDTKYSSSYNEMSDSELAINDSHSYYKTSLNGVNGDLQYKFPNSKFGYFYILGRGDYQISKYLDSPDPFHQTSSTVGGQLNWFKFINKVTLFAVMGLDWNHTSTSTGDVYNLVVPTPRIQIDWKIRHNMRLSVNYSYGSSAPSISQLSETNQWLDTRLVYHGNSLLRPYKTHSVGLRYSFSQKYIDLSLNGTFESSPGRICEMYQLTDQFMLQTIVNLSKYWSILSRVSMGIKFLGNNKLVWWNYLTLGHNYGKNPEYYWNSNRLQWMSNLRLRLSRWMFDLYYQYPGKVIEGQTILPRAQVWAATVYYRPVINLWLGLDLRTPFGKGMKEGEYTVADAPVYYNKQYTTMDTNNLVTFKLLYNFSFGRNKNTAKPEFDNLKNDSGILRK